jgi:hypothetical protein
LIGCAYCIAVYKQQYPWDPEMYRDRTLEGSAPPLWQKVFYFGAFASDLYGDATDQVVLWVSVAVMGWSGFRRWRDRRSASSHPARGAEPSAIVAPLLAAMAAYFATPMVLIGTHLIFPRLAQWTLLGAVLATPRFPKALAPRAHRYMTRLGLLAGLNACAHCLLFQLETGDASAVIDDLPPGLAATAIIWEPGTIAFRNGTLTHLAGYYAARKHGRWAFAFARYLSVPVRFKPGSQPPWPAAGWEFSAEDYSPRCRYARAFPLVIVRAPESFSTGPESEAPLRALLFRGDARQVELLSHHGRFWAFDTSAIAGDGSI